VERRAGEGRREQQAQQQAYHDAQCEPTVPPAGRPRRQQELSITSHETA
jgi:hypothetical protein